MYISSNLSKNLVVNAILVKKSPNIYFRTDTLTPSDQLHDELILKLGAVGKNEELIIFQLWPLAKKFKQYFKTRNVSN